MTAIRLVDLNGVQKLGEFGLRSRSGASFRLIRDTKVQPPTMSFNLYKEGQKVPTLLEREVPLLANNVQGDIENRGAVVLHKIDLGMETGEGIGFAIINIFARIAQEAHKPFAITRTCNMGLVRAIERVTDLHFQGHAYDVFLKQATVNPGDQKFTETFGEAGIHLADSRLTRPVISYDVHAGGYFLTDDRCALISFAVDKDGELRLYKKLPSKIKVYAPDIPSGAYFRGFTFNPDGTLSYDGKNIGYSVALNFQLLRVQGENPRPVEDLTIEV